MSMTAPRDSVILSGREWSQYFAAATSGSSKIGRILSREVKKPTKRSFSLECVVII